MDSKCRQETWTRPYEVSPSTERSSSPVFIHLKVQVPRSNPARAKFEILTSTPHNKRRKVERGCVEGTHMHQGRSVGLEGNSKAIGTHTSNCASSQLLYSLPGLLSSFPCSVFELQLVGPPQTGSLFLFSVKAIIIKHVCDRHWRMEKERVRKMGWGMGIMGICVRPSSVADGDWEGSFLDHLIVKEHASKDGDYHIYLALITVPESMPSSSQQRDSGHSDA
ncbi:hypothetical protein FPV67DRAFT_1452789 [Lyophyllum atratum]|nr:hypothetical protein FPV67DRAFT_1452789 [Lyophyllum atratum]